MDLRPRHPHRAEGLTAAPVLPREPIAPTMLRLATWTMGTRFELVLVGADPVRLRAAGEEALAELERVGRELSWFARDSRLSHWNRAAAHAPVRLDGPTFELLERCRILWRASGGAFDPSVAPLMAAHGFRDEALDGGADARPDAEAARRAVGLDALLLERAGHILRYARPDLSLDLGGVAKGHGLDLAGEVLREAGVERALLHGGTSSVLALGPPPGEAAWRVRLGADTDAPVAELLDGALSVSAPSGRTVLARDASRGGSASADPALAPGAEPEPTSDPEVLGHVLDPRTGAPARGVAGAAVLAASAAVADAWSTALVVAGDALPPLPGVDTLLRPAADGPWRAPAGAPAPDRSPHEASAARSRFLPAAASARAPIPPSLSTSTR